MNIAKLILALMLCSIYSVHGHSTVRWVIVGGDVPKPGMVSLNEAGMTIDSVMAEVGMDLGPFYAKGKVENDGERCPIRVVVCSQGKERVYDPSVDSGAMRAQQLKFNDIIVVKDMRKYPEQIAGRRQRIEKMLDLGSIQIMDELLSLAKLQREYAEWRGESVAATPGSNEHLKKQAARLVGEGKGKRILGIIELKKGALELDGLGPNHPEIKSTMNLIQIFRDLIPK